MIMKKFGKYTFALILGLLCALVFSTSHILIDELPFFNYEATGKYPVTNEAFGMELVDAYCAPSHEFTNVPLTFANYLYTRYPEEAQKITVGEGKEKRAIKTAEEYAQLSSQNSRFKQIVDRDPEFAAKLKTIKKAKVMNNFYRGTGYGVIIFFLLILFSSYLNRSLEKSFLKRSEEELRAELEEQTSYLQKNKTELETGIAILKTTKDVLLEDYADLEQKYSDKQKKLSRDFASEIDLLNKKLELEKERIDTEIRDYKTDSQLNKHSKDDDDDDDQIVTIK